MATAHKGVGMDRCLIVANKTLMSEELLKAVLARRDERPCQFHLVVPATHPWGAWSQGSVRAMTKERLAEGIAYFAEHGVTCDGDIGDHNPVRAVTDLLAHDSDFDEIIVSTLPVGPSAWIHEDVPARLRRMVHVPVTHVITAPQRHAAAV